MRGAAVVFAVALLLVALLGGGLCADDPPAPFAVREDNSGGGGGRVEAVYINLDRRGDRRESFERDWARSDLRSMRLNRFSAVDGSKVAADAELISAQGLEDLRRSAVTSERETHFQLTRGAVGCFLSHFGVWERFAAREDLDRLWLFEDDVSLPRDLGRRVAALGPPPADFDVLLLGFVCTKCDAEPVRERFHRARQFHLLHAMVISRKGLRKLVALRGRLFPIDQQVDAALSELTDDLVVYTAGTEPLVHQDNGFETDIQLAMPTFASEARTRGEHREGS